MAFQYAHFGDDTKPNDWFVTERKALNFELEFEDELGHYEDGVKRTLTDEQIAIFRRRELWALKRAHENQVKEEVEAQNAEAGEAVGTPERDMSPVSDASSLEDELLAFATTVPMTAARPPRLSELESKSEKQQSSQSSRSESTRNSQSRKKKRREKEVPYDQRHKRKWEAYIENEDPIEGSMTHRRMVRELDDQQHETVEMNY